MADLSDASLPPEARGSDFVLWLRCCDVILSMIEHDVRAGTYGRMGRPNFTSLRIFLAMGSVNVPELRDLSLLASPDIDFAAAIKAVGDLDDLREQARDLRAIVEALPPNEGIQNALFPNPDGSFDGYDVSERDRLLAVLDGGSVSARPARAPDYPKWSSGAPRVPKGVRPTPPKPNTKAN